MKRKFRNLLAEFAGLLRMPGRRRGHMRFVNERSLAHWDVALNMNRNTSPFCGTSHPALKVLCGMSDGLPVGLMLTGKFRDEATIYRAAFALEQSGDWKFM